MNHQQGDLMKLCKRRDCFEERQGELGYCSFHEASGTDQLMRALYPDMWDEKRPKVFEQIRSMIASGTIKDPSTISEVILNQAFQTSFTDLDEYQAYMTKAVAGWEQTRLNHQQGQSTTVPSLERSSEQRGPPASLHDAIGLGLEDALKLGTPQ